MAKCRIAELMRYEDDVFWMVSPSTAGEEMTCFRFLSFYVSEA
jgi:hypothetical protein